MRRPPLIIGGQRPGEFCLQTDSQDRASSSQGTESIPVPPAVSCFRTKMETINGSNGAEPVRIWKARNFIEAHASEELSLGKVAQAANTSANYFSEKFKEATGMNFVAYVARTRFEKAAALLREDDLRVSEIAFATGFQSLSQFNRIFRKFAGKSPTEYRASVRAKKKQRR